MIPPRPGVAGLYDLLTGRAAPPLEQAGAWTSALAGALVGAAVPPTHRERALGAVFGFDAGGGVWVNESAAGKRWYRRAGQAWWEPAAFASLHVHPLVIEAVSGRRSWWWSAVAWAVPVAGSAVAASLPAARQRPAAMALAVGGGLVDAALAPRGWRWLAILLAWKLVVGHATEGGPLARALGDRPVT